MAFLPTTLEPGETMTTIRTLITCSVSALMLGGALTGCAAVDRRAAGSLDGIGAAGRDRGTAALAQQTRRILTQRDGAGAVAFAERLVTAEPHRADYRALLGQSYLQAGRFASARQAFAETLELDPTDGRAALNLSLALIAGGDGEAARAVLGRHADHIPATDLGLAMALAGGTGEGVKILTAAAREPEASPKTRQNLALALALAGQWDMARMAASADMAPADVEQRMQEWAAFASATSPADQVAGLLGVRRAVDTGQPLMLALNAAPPVAVIGSQPAEEPVAPSTEPAFPQNPASMAQAPAIVFAARQAVVQPLPMMASETSRVARMAPALVTTPALLRRVEERRAVAPQGDWNVQIGAFANEAGAQKAWALLTRQFAGLSGYAPSSATLRRPEGDLYRLSVGGLTRPQADTLCGRYREAGGACFVRQRAGDQVVHWARPGIGLAAL
ncbi:tetratricopeptide repeat protein [Sphingomonas paucimobilis]|uniref:SPOR domain-containing protein n=1 Tax=Sphingomonas paucimobilis TaxID=13689 RepID=UPI0028D358DB|nr:tetratricopeptide repeat protein [Sphingomonas paucimobilis]